MPNKQMESMEFKKHLTSCLYALSGFHHAFTKINFQNGLIYLDEGGTNALPVRLSDVSEVQVIGLGELRVIDGEYKWVKW